MNFSRRHVKCVSYRLPAAPCVASENGPSPGPEQCVVVFLLVLTLLCTSCSTTARSNCMNFSRRPVLGVSYRLPAAPCVASENGPSLGPAQCVFVPFLVFFALFRHPVLYNGSFKLHYFHAAARGRVWTCRPRRGTRLGKPLGGWFRSPTVCGGGWWRRMVLALLSTPCSTTARSNRMNFSQQHVQCVSYRLLVAPFVASECGPSLGPEQCVFVPFLSFSLCSATPFATTTRSNHTTFMRRHVAGSGSAGPGVARVRATLWAVGSVRRSCVGGAWWRRVVLALLCTPCSTTARSNRMNFSRRHVQCGGYRLPAAPCVANECGPSLGPEQCVVVSLFVYVALCRHVVCHNGSFKSHDFHAEARGRVWTCRPWRGTRLGNPLGGRVRSSSVCGRCLWRRVVLALLCTSCSTTARSNRMNISRRHVQCVGHRLPAAPCVANECGPSLGPEQCVDVSLFVYVALFRHPVLYNGSFKSHDFHAAARGRVWTCRPRRGTHLGNPLGGRVRSLTVCLRCPMTAGGFDLAVHPVLYHGSFKSHEFPPTARSMCNLSTAGGLVRGK
jgi:hypothetical protein